MQRQALLSLATLLTIGSVGGALAQSADLSGVTMRVLDDVSDIKAVVLELDVNRGETEDGAAATPAEDDTEARDEAAAREDAPTEERRAERRERNDLRDADRDERSEGQLEDRDVVRPAVPPTTPVP